MKNDKKLIYGLIAFGLLVLLTFATSLLVNTIKDSGDLGDAIKNQNDTINGRNREIDSAHDAARLAIASSEHGILGTVLGMTVVAVVFPVLLYFGYSIYINQRKTVSEVQDLEELDRKIVLLNAEYNHRIRIRNRLNNDIKLIRQIETSDISMKTTEQEHSCT